MKLLLFCTLSITLMVLDHQQRYLQTYVAKMRSTLDIVVSPLYFIVDIPSLAFHWIKNDLMTHRTLLEENASLKAEKILLQVKLQKLMALESENAELHVLLKSVPHLDGRWIAARLLSVSTNFYHQQLVVNKGSKDELFVGQPVLDAHGLLGQIMRVGPAVSHVLLISDARSAIPVENTRNGMRAILTGTGQASQLELLSVAKTADVKVGDLLVTSSLVERFPPGYPVGVVQEVTQNSGDNFAKVLVAPSADLTRSHLVLLVWPSLKQKDEHVS